jgi:hypothetical protein
MVRITTKSSSPRRQYTRGYSEDGEYVYFKNWRERRKQIEEEDVLPEPPPPPAEKPRPAPHPQPEADDHAGDARISHDHAGDACARISQGELVERKVEEASSTGDVQSTETNESKCSP